METAIIKDLSLLINSIGVGVCFLLSYVYFPKSLKIKNVGKGMLSFLFFIIGFIILNTILNFTGYSRLITGFEPISNAFCFALAPLLYLHIRSGRKKLDKPWFFSIHLWLFYTYMLFSIIILFSPYTGLFNPGFRLMQSDAIVVFWNIQFACYAIMAYRELHSNTKSKNIGLIYWGIVSIWLINTLLFVYRILFAELPQLLYLNITLLFTFLMLKVAYSELTKKMNAAGRKNNNYKKSVVHYDEGDEAVLLQIEINKYYRDSSLDIRKLSEYLDMPYPRLSRLINQKYQKNFNEFINAYRIAEVVKGLLSDHHSSYTIMGLAQEAGFKSGSAFYTAFKREKGMTPKAYLRQLTSS